MDYGNDYIKMCEKADDIQKAWEAHCGDWLILDHHRRLVLLTSPNPELREDPLRMISVAFPQTFGYPFTDLKWREECIWLPRQDQLQTLSRLSWKAFDIECLKYDADTKEQAGIQVVMASNFNKKWQNDEWIA